MEDGINGSLLLFVVSLYVLSILENIISPYLNLSMQVVLFINLFFYLLRVLFYLIVICIIFYRTTFFSMKANEFKPSYWIDMGASAISVLTGVMLIKSMNGIITYKDFIPTIKLLSVLFLIASTWWIPVVCFLEVWRLKTIQVKYNAGFSSMVFHVGI